MRTQHNTTQHNTVEKLSKGLAIILFVILMFNVKSIAQTEMVCGNEEIPSASDTIYANRGFCFDIEEILEGCDEGKFIWIKVNLHFFTTTDCKGSVQVFPGATQTNLYRLGEEYIELSNALLAGNFPQWVTETTASCIPFRYVLKGIYVHCKSNAVGNNFSDMSQNYAVNKDSELNIFIANLPATQFSNPTGQVNGIGNTYSLTAIDWCIPGNLNHEIGHLLDLNHAHEIDNIADTPTLRWNWDGNCDGNYTSTHPDLFNKFCWSYEGDSQADRNSNMVNDCEEEEPCEIYPCCSWSWVNNNTMGYNAYQNCFTAGQIERMLQNLDGFKCDFIETISECPPPNAFVSQTPFSLATNDCFQCLYLHASVNETKYRYIVYKNTVGGPIEVENTGWVNGEATTYCYNVIAGTNKLDPNTSYTIVLTVENECEEQDQISYNFTTPTSGCGNETIKTFNLKSPNPTDGSLRIKFNAEDNEIYQIKVFDANTSGSIVITENFQAADEGENEVILDLSGLSNGSYYVLAWGQFNIYGGTVIKI
ncbi:MAG: hypothetical protein IPN79_18500 [Saprospiraceae bacterium]|nr:hypothetical protein [Saprospiraceae bacterium]